MRFHRKDAKEAKEECVAQTPLRLCGKKLILDQPVANAGFRAQVAGFARVGLQLLAQVRHEHAQIVRVVLRIGAPKFAQNLPVGDDLAAVLHEHAQEAADARGSVLPLLRSQLVAAVHRRSFCRRVDSMRLLFSDISDASHFSNAGSGRQPTARCKFFAARWQRTEAR